MDEDDAQWLCACLRPWYAPLRQLGSLRLCAKPTLPANRTAPRVLWVHSEPSKTSKADQNDEDEDEERDDGDRDGDDDDDVYEEDDSGYEDENWSYRDDTDQKPRLSPQTLEGLSLLGLLARVDTPLWLRVLKQVWHDQPSCDWIDTELAPLMASADTEPFTVGLSWIVAAYEDLSSLLEEVPNWDGRSDPFKEALRLMKLGGADAKTRVPVRLGFSFKFEDGCSWLSEVLGMLVDLAESQQDKKPAHLSYKFDIQDYEAYVDAGGTDSLEEYSAQEQDDDEDDDYVCVGFDIVQLLDLMSIRAALNDEALASLAKLVELGVVVDELPDLECSLYSESDATSLISSLQTIMSQPGIQSVIVSDRTASSRLTEAVLSTCQYAPSVRTMRLWMRGPTDGYDLGEQPAIWRVIAQSLFSRYASHQQIDHLEMSLAYFSQLDLAAVMRVMKEEEHGPSPANPFRVGVDTTSVTASKFHLFNPTHKFLTDKKPKTQYPYDNELRVYESRVPVQVRVLDAFTTPDRKQWRSVLLPGRGEAWVEAKDVNSTTTNSETPTQRHASPPSFPVITIDRMSDPSMRFVAPLLEIIGRGTHTLTITNKHSEKYSMDNDYEETCRRVDSLSPNIQEWSRRVLTACPQLREFEFNCHKFDCLQSFVDCAASGASQLRCLAISAVSDTSTDHIISFLRALSEPSHPLAVHLQQLSLEFRIATKSSLKPILQATKEMLHKNRSLQKITIGFKLRCQIAHLKSEIKAALASHVAEKVWIPTLRWDMRGKAALLSVFRSKLVLSSSLDSGVVSRIFQFAAPVQQREVRVVFGDTFYASAAEYSRLHAQGLW